MRPHFVIGLAAALAGCAAAPPNMQPWPAAGKKALVEECQAQIWRRAERDYLAAHRPGGDRLPADFRATASAAMQPSLDACACYMDRLEREWSYEQLAAGTAKLDGKLAEITASGACTPARR